MNAIPFPSGLYVHIPFCDGKCGYCAFYSIPYEASLADRFLATLEKELNLARDAGIAPAAETVFIGGGTPSVLSAAQLERLCAILMPYILKAGHTRNPQIWRTGHGEPSKKDSAWSSLRSQGPCYAEARQGPAVAKLWRTGHLALPKEQKNMSQFRKESGAATREWSVEMNPGSMSTEKTAALVRAGVNRISLGAQSFDDRVLRTLGRRHSVEDIVQAVALVRRAGVDNFGLDLLAGVPGFDAVVWRNTLDQAVALDPCHISVYALTREEGTCLSRAIDRGESALLADEEQLTALATAETVLSAAGYRRYEISNYAKPGCECRHHCDCWRGGEYLGIGPAAASHVGLERWTNRPDLAAYLEALEGGGLPPRDMDPLTPALKVMERVVFGLRMAEGINAETASQVEPGLRRLQQQGLVEFNNGCWTLTRRGWELADAVAVELMGYVYGRTPESF